MCVFTWRGSGWSKVLWGITMLHHGKHPGVAVCPPSRIYCNTCNTVTWVSFVVFVRSCVSLGLGQITSALTLKNRLMLINWLFVYIKARNSLLQEPKDESFDFIGAKTAALHCQMEKNICQVHKGDNNCLDQKHTLLKWITNKINILERNIQSIAWDKTSNLAGGYSGGRFHIESNGWGEVMTILKRNHTWRE